MLPVTTASRSTCRHSLLYVVLLCAASVAPYLIGMSGPGTAAALAPTRFSGPPIALCRNYSDALARRTFRWSIIYLTLLFAALLVDHFA
jgi:protoheme IX farnesyltransferase